MTRWIPGHELRVGDTIRVWWNPGRDTITGLEEYTGPLATTFSEGARIATFAILPRGMTLPNAEAYELVARP